MKTLKKNALKYLESMREGNSWAFKFSRQNSPTLIGSSLAGMLGGLLGFNRKLAPEQKSGWANFINSFQRDDGWFEDWDIAKENLRPGYQKERALLHRTRHALFALKSLDSRPVKRFTFIDCWLEKGAMRNWADRLNLADYWYTSNMMMDAAIFLMEHSMSTGDQRGFAAVNELLDFCDGHINPATGYHDAGLSEIRNAMAGAMHLYPVYVVMKRPIKFADKAIETTLSLQQADGLFGYESGTGGEDCLDYDAVLILSNLGFQCPEYRRQIIDCFAKVREGLLFCENKDGGFCAHRRKETYYFGTWTTPVAPGESSLWATYSRLMTLVMIECFKGEEEAAGLVTGHNLMEVWDGGRGIMDYYFMNNKE